MMKHTRRALLAPLAAALALALAGCGARAPIGLADGVTPQPTPSLAPMFAAIPTPTPRPPVTSTPRPTAAPARPATSATPGPTAVDPLADLQVVPVYDDELANGWALANSDRMDFITRSELFVDAGKYALEAQALSEFSSLYFTVRRDAKTPLLRDRVVGLRFRLSGGDQAIGNEELAVTIVGSNSQPYWVADDSSVTPPGRVTNDEPLFSETRLSYLGINSAIPADEWSDVIVWLDELLFDPDYTYVTGFYLKTDGLERFFVDDVALLLAPEAAATPTATP